MDPEVATEGPKNDPKGKLFDTTVVLRVEFRRLSRWRSWECQLCGAKASDLVMHASWHAHIQAGAQMKRPNPFHYSGQIKVIHVQADGWPIR